MIEHQYRARRHVMQRRYGIGAGGARRQPLEVAHHVVRRKADESPGERHAADVGLRRRRTCKRRTQAVEQLGCAARQRTALTADREASGVEPYLEPVAEADEGVAREPLASLDALEQEARREGAELHERRYGSIEVTGNVER